MTSESARPRDAFTLAAGDKIRISLDPVGTLINTVAPGRA